MIIAISGKINSGKDTVGKIIQYLTVSDYENVKHILKERNDKDISVEEHFNSFIARDYKVQWEIKRFADKLKDMVCMLIGCTREQLEDRGFKERELGEEWDRYEVFNPSYPEQKYIYKIFSTREEAQKCVEDFEGFGKTPGFVKMDIRVVRMTPRLLMQLLGTKCGRQIIHPNIWVNSLMREYKLIKDTKVSEFLKAEGLPETMNGGKKYYPNWIITDMRFLNEMEAVKKRNGITIRVNRNLEESKDQHESETELDNAKFDYVIDNNGTIEELIEKVREILTKEKLI